jgi:hypothetical protein
LGFSWLWGHFEGLRFGVQCTIFGVCGGEKRSSIFEDKKRRFVSNLGGSKLVYFKDFFNQALIKIWK